MTVIAVIAAVALVVLVASAVALAARPGATAPRLLRPGLLRRAVRSLRTSVARAGCAVLAWPHVVDRAGFAWRMPLPSSLVAPVATSGPARLHRLYPTEGEPVLLVHSLIGRAWVLDLTPETSIAGALASAGFDVWLLDWADVDVAASTLAEHVQAVGWAQSQIARSRPRARVHVVGYCLGATLTLLYFATGASAGVASLTLVAPVVDTSVPGGMALVLSHPRLHPALALDGRGRVPGVLVREAFHLLRPRAVRTVLRGRRLPPDDAVRRHYAAMARWTWDHRDLDGRTWFDLVDVHRGNPLVRARLTFDAPVLVVCAAHDHIVPLASSLAITAVLPAPPDVQVVERGHVGMLVGGGDDGLAPRLVAWLLEHASSARQ